MKELSNVFSHSHIPEDGIIIVHLTNGYVITIYDKENYHTYDGIKTRRFTDGFRYHALDGRGMLTSFELDKYVQEDRMTRILIDLGNE